MTSSFVHTTGSFQQGAKTMPGEYYVSDEIFLLEKDRIFAREWVLVGRSDRLAQPGDFFTRSIAGESLIFLRDRAGALRAFFNVCRHRGTRLCAQESGQFSETIQCQYHAWTYGTDGRLIGAPHMQEVEGFNKADYPLHQAALHEWEGFLFVNLAANPVPFEESHQALIGRFARFGLADLKVGHKVSYDVRTNWKLVFQNYSECLHCPVIHPELSARMPYQSGANDLTEGQFLGGYMVISEPAVSVTMSGAAAGRPIASLSEEDKRRAFYYSIMPNMLLSIQPDYVNYYMIWPVGAGETRVESEWLFHPEAFGRADFNPQDAIDFWDVTNRQDWRITEESHLGIKSRRYQPGPYSARESIPAAWDRAYLELIGGTR
ncbi:MAG: aromatic ring-hydroxylating dioxygenase subunit alpha [Gemmatimonadales bacterium]|nr:aromatic ring-hydroxylating dioxygenase subunit alpha [Gemmatimonadales bacterium]